jgi:hypothetical protein
MIALPTSDVVARHTLAAKFLYAIGEAPSVAAVKLTAPCFGIFDAYDSDDPLPGSNLMSITHR